MSAAIFMAVMLLNGVMCFELQGDELLLQGSELIRLGGDMLRSWEDHMEHLSLIDVPLMDSIDVDCFSHLTKLRSIYIWGAPKLKMLPRKILTPGPQHLRSLRILNSGLEELPDLNSFNATQILHIIDFEGNRLKKLRSYGIKVRADQLLLDSNLIEEIEENAFHGSELKELSLKGNVYLKVLHPDSFAGLVGIQELDISSTSIVHLPAAGLATMEILRAQNTITMKTVPSIHDFKDLKQAWLTHHFHCCAFQFPERHDPKRHEEYLLYKKHMMELCSGTGPDHDVSGKSVVKRSLLMNKSENFVHHIPRGWGNIIIDDNTPDEYPDDEFGGNFHNFPIPTVSELDVKVICTNFTEKSDGWNKVECWPESDSLNPCEDVLGGAGARGLGWAAGLAATLGNLAVTAVLLTRPLAAPRLLLLLLAVADLGTALYLLLIAAVDTYTADNYFNYAYDWQYGFGCPIAGFLAVWGAQASLLALAALTLERWLAITRAMFPQRRLSLRGARILLLISICYSIMLAAAPLFGASHYSSTSICLPMRRDNWADTIYLGCLLSGGLLCLVAVIGCYCHIYLTIANDRGNSNISGDARIANKMAVLVSQYDSYPVNASVKSFVLQIAIHMACCIPVAAVGFGALIDHPILGVHGAKLLLVLIYPLNALADPFLYALLTHQFRRDLYLLLDRYGLCTRKAQQYKIPGVVGRHRRSRLPNSNNVPRRPDGSLTTAYEDLLV